MEKDKEDVINKPNHYHKGGIDPIAVMESKFTPEMLEGFFAGNAIKYVIRYPDKGKPVEDLEKAQFYINKLIELQRLKTLLDIQKGVFIDERV